MGPWTRAASAAILAVWCAACAAAVEDGGSIGEPHDASVDATDDLASPSPDAVVYGRDGRASGGDAAGDSADASASGGDGGSTGKSCEGLPDGTLCGAAPDDCHDPPVCAAGACATPTAKPNGTVCATAPDGCHTDGTCSSGVCGAVGTQPNGFNWQSGNPYAICCSGDEVHTDASTNCGACGIKCNASNGETCELLGGHYFCRGCIASDACWSKCCSESFTPHTCAASDCNTGACSAQYCPPGTHCVLGDGTSSNYCAY